MPTFDSSAGTFASSVSSLTWNHTVAAGAGLIVSLAWNNSSGLTPTVTYGGVAMTANPYPSMIAPGLYTCQFSLVGLTAKTAAVVASFGGTITSGAGMSVSATGTASVNTNSAWKGGWTGGGVGPYGPNAGSFTTGSLVVDCVACSATGFSGTPTVTQTARQNIETVNGGGGTSYFGVSSTGTPASNVYSNGLTFTGESFGTAGSWSMMEFVPSAGHSGLYVPKLVIYPPVGKVIL